MAWRSEPAPLSAVVVADGDPDQARAWCDELLDLAWSLRAEFVYRPEPLAPTYVLASLPGESKPEFLLILPGQDLAAAAQVAQVKTGGHIHPPTVVTCTSQPPA